MEHGKVVESGNHDQLMAKTGVYFSLVTLQSQDKKKDEEVAREGMNEEKPRSSVISRSSSRLSRKESLRQRASTRASSRASAFSNPIQSIKDAYEDVEKVDEFDEDNLPPTSTLRLMKLNSSEWPQLLLGSISAAVNGSVLPLAAWLISFILGYLSETDAEKKQDGIIKYCIGFVIIAFVQLLTQFLQGYLFGVSGKCLS